VTAHDGPAGAEVRQLFDRTDVPPTEVPVGYLGLNWRPVHSRDTRRWEVQGFVPGARVPGIRLTVSRVLAGADQEEVARVVASLLGSITEDEGSLMAASLMQEGQNDE
jgi:hypothetical protein